jgi:hypothetical protein
MQTFNAFLRLPREAKGGGALLERLEAVENFVFQTAGAEPEPFEAELADRLMEVFAAGLWELAQVVAALNERAFRDSRGTLWTESSLREQLARSAARLFASEERA